MGLEEGQNKGVLKVNWSEYLIWKVNGKDNLSKEDDRDLNSGTMRQRSLIGKYKTRSSHCDLEG